MKKWISLLFIPCILVSCIGTDILEEEIFPERVQITMAADTIKVGENFQFSALFFNSTGEVEETNFTWQSMDESIFSIDQMGLATALNPGRTHIIVQAASVSDSIEVTAGEVTVISNTTPRSGMFVGLNNYDVEGDFTLELVSDSVVRLSFDSNFKTQNGPGLYIYLTNNENSISGGLDLGQLKANSGEQFYEFNQPDLFNAIR